MTTKIEDGGPAFPVNELNQQTGLVFAQFMGMTLRDYFAANVAQGILAGGWADTVPLDDMDHARQLAEFAYASADAMIKAREVSND